MTYADYTRLPQDVKDLIYESFKQFLRDTKRALTNPAQLTEFVSNIEYRLDSGLTYFGSIKKYNPHQ